MQEPGLQLLQVNKVFDRSLMGERKVDCDQPNYKVGSGWSRALMGPAE